jgi:hypothetical protein
MVQTPKHTLRKNRVRVRLAIIRFANSWKLNPKLKNGGLSVEDQKTPLERQRLHRTSELEESQAMLCC